MRIEEAVELAVTECIREGILADFLTAQRTEVIAVSIFEYNEEEEMRKIRASEYKNGKEEGIEEGIIETCKELGVSFQQTGEKLKLRFALMNGRHGKRYGIIWADRVCFKENKCHHGGVDLW